MSDIPSGQRRFRCFFGASASGATSPPLNNNVIVHHNVSQRKSSCQFGWHPPTLLATSTLTLMTGNIIVWLNQWDCSEQPWRHKCSILKKVLHCAAADRPLHICLFRDGGSVSFCSPRKQSRNPSSQPFILHFYTSAVRSISHTITSPLLIFSASINTVGFMFNSIRLKMCLHTDFLSDLMLIRAGDL